jgi:hypothetical protein
MPIDLLGPEVLPGTREYEWVASVVAAVERRTGRPSSWNRRLYEELGETGGIAQIGGHLRLSREHVLDPVLRAYDANRPTDLETTGGARLGVLLLVHEIDHQQHEEGDETAPDAVRHASKAGEALTEGLADSNRDRIADPVMHDIGIDAAVPRIHDLTVPTLYGGYQAGVEGVLHGLHTISGRPADEVRTAVDVTPFAQRYNAMADVLIDSRLRGVMPPEHRSQIRLRLTRPLQEELGSLTDHYNAMRETPQQLTDRGRDTGARAVLRLEQELSTVEAHYQGHGEHPPRMPMTAQERAQVQEIEAFYGRPPIEFEPAELRQFLDSGAGRSAGAGAAAPGAVETRGVAAVASTAATAAAPTSSAAGAADRAAGVAGGGGAAGGGAAAGAAGSASAGAGGAGEAAVAGALSGAREGWQAGHRRAERGPTR